MFYWAVFTKYFDYGRILSSLFFLQVDKILSLIFLDPIIILSLDWKII